MQMNTLAATGLDWTRGPLSNQLCPRLSLNRCRNRGFWKAHRPRSQAELASIAPKSEYTIIPFQYGKGDLVTCARMSCET